MERVFAARDEATAAAFAPLAGWNGGSAALDAALAHAVLGYLAFLLDRPTFLQLLVREELHEGAGLDDVRRASSAMRDAFSAVRDRGLDHDPDDAVLVFVTSTFSAVALGPTLMTTLGRDLRDIGHRRRHAALVVRQLRALLTYSSAGQVPS